ncbi:MAG: ChaN family lipoprotein [Nitrospirae bacterium]|nr:ChaN family lipoprotein [Nitrospirota bacterium]
MIEIGADEGGLSLDNEDQTIAIDVSAVKSLPEVLERVSGKKIVYVGEFHDRFSNHAVELEAVKALYQKNRKIAIGMEMFQRPFQQVLDKYIAGTIDERTMLKGTEYFKRWGFDYNLYRPILTFARSERVPVIALNIRREITDKVSKGGLDSLSEGDKKEIPSQMDFSDNQYREELYEVFKRHEGSKEMNFDFFYTSQVLWDESMSQSVDDFLKSNPDFQVVVLAGNGHLAFGTGIPKRTFRRNGLSYATILNDVDIESDVADYIIYPKPVEGTTAPRIMAVMKEAEGRVVVKGFPEGSISEAAGLREGDIILSVDDTPVAAVDDIRIHLLYKKKGDTVHIKILRKRFLLGDTEKDFSILL